MAPRNRHNEEGPVLLFSLGINRFAVSLKYIEIVLSESPLMPTYGLPPIFSGYVNFKKNMIPCLSLENLLFPEMTNFGAKKSDSLSNIIVLKTTESINKNILALIAEKIDARFTPEGRHLKKNVVNSVQNSFFSYQLEFGEKVYAYIDIKKLFETIEISCIAESLHCNNFMDVCQ